MTTTALTARQQQILAALEASTNELSGQALHAGLQQQGNAMGLATVYRNLRVLQQQGKVRCRHLPSGEALYAPLGRDVHHLTCLECGSSEPLNFCPMEQQGMTLPTPDGFRPLFHTLEVFGYCVNCSSHG